MKKYKKTVLVIAVLCLVFALSACGDRNKFERVRSFELNFSQEEYADEYNEVKKDITLENNANYQINIDSLCKSGTITIKATYITSDNEMKVVDMTEPGDYTIALSKGTTDRITFSISIDPETEGHIKVDILSDNT